MSPQDTPKTDAFEIVVANESPVLGNRYRAWADFARTLERENAALLSQVARLREGLKEIDRIAYSHKRGGIGLAQKLARALLAETEGGEKETKK